jgi:hypothetical protein
MQTDMRERSKKERECEKISKRARTSNAKKELDQKKKEEWQIHTFLTANNLEHQKTLFKN